MLTGYLHPGYVSSLAEFGTPIPLPLSAGALLKRRIPGTAHSDAMGPYPLFTCLNWGNLSHDLMNLRRTLVSIVLVADPFGDYDSRLLVDTFSRVVPFKQHYVIETGRSLESFISRSHRENARRALRRVDVSVCPDPLAVIDDWERLYGVLIERHHINGLRRFSRAAFRTQLAIPGIVMFCATVGP